MLPTDAKERKETPIARGVLDYFPDAVAAVAQASFLGNQQHNPGEEMHWDKTKSTDHSDCIVRHLLEHGTIDTDGVRHAAKVAWRALALLQTEIDAETPPPSTTVQFENHYEENGCPPEIAKQILGGHSYDVQRYDGKAVYIAGPMRGYEDFNFAAFDTARNLFINRGWMVISPADIDRAADDVDAENPESADTIEAQKRFVFRDFHAIYGLNSETDAIAMLPGWEKSAGATAEFMLARWLQLEIRSAITGDLLPNMQSFELRDSVQSYLRYQSAPE